MRWLLNTFNQDLRLALAGYNAGEGAVMKYGWQIPPYSETQEYVRRITTRYNSIRNPNYIARTVKKVTVTEAAKLEKKESAPLTIYEPERGGDSRCPTGGCGWSTNKFIQSFTRVSLLLWSEKTIGGQQRC